MIREKLAPTGAMIRSYFSAVRIPIIAHTNE